MQQPQNFFLTAHTTFNKQSFNQTTISCSGSNSEVVRMKNNYQVHPLLNSLRWNKDRLFLHPTTSKFLSQQPYINQTIRINTKIAYYTFISYFSGLIFFPSVMKEFLYFLQVLFSNYHQIHYICISFLLLKFPFYHLSS